MGSLKDRILDALLALKGQELDIFKWYLEQRENVAGLRPLKRNALENAKITDVVDQIVQSFPDKECLIMVTVLTKLNRRDLAGMFGDTPTGRGTIAENPLLAQQMLDLQAEFEKLNAASNQQRVEASRPSRDAFLKHTSPLSLDPNTANRRLILSEDRKVTYTEQDQGYPEHPERFTIYPNVLSRESLSVSGRSYFEVEWSGESVYIAVSYKDINRKEKDLSDFGYNDKSWMLDCGGPDGDKLYGFAHNSIRTAVSGPASSTGGIRFAVFVDQPEGVLSYYSVDVDRNTMSLLHTERTTFTRPLYAGISTYKSTAEVCKIW